MSSDPEYYRQAEESFRKAKQTISGLNRQTRYSYDSDWVDRGNVTYEQAAIAAAKESSLHKMRIEVRCESSPDNVREFTVKRKPTEYIVEGLRGEESEEVRKT